MKPLRALVTILLLLINLTAIQAQSNGKSAYPIGLQLYNLRDYLPRDVYGYIDKVEDMGIRELEGGGTYGMSIKDFLQLCADHRLNMIAIGADYNELATAPEKAIDQAKAFGVRFVVVYWIPHADGPLSPEDADKAISVFRTAGKKLADAGITLCYHPHGYEFTPYKNGTVFDYMVSQLDPAVFNFELDVYWAKQGGADPLALLRKYPNRFPLVHLKDRKPGTPDSTNGHADVETNVVLGTGDVGIGPILQEARKLGVKHFFIEDESSRVLEQLPPSIQFIRKNLR